MNFYIENKNTKYVDKLKKTMIYYVCMTNKNE